MRKTLVGVIAAAIIIGTGAYFGSKLWAQLQAKSEIEAVFESLRGRFATVTYGKIEFEPISRTVKIPQVVLQSSDQSTTIKFELITASGASTPSADHFAADRIEIVNGEFATTLPTAGGLEVSYKAPKILIEAYSGPVALPRKPESASTVEMAAMWLEFIAASSANAITIPKLAATVTLSRSNAATSVMEPFEYNYTDIVFREIRNRRIGEMTVERVTLSSETALPDLGKFAAAMARFSLIDFNLDAPIALLDSAKAKDDNYVSVYRQASVGPLEVRFANGGNLQVEGLSIEGIALRPSKLSLANMLAMTDKVPKPGTPPSPEQLRSLMDEVAGIYEGIRFTKMEMRGFRSDLPPGGVVKLGAIRLTGLENGRLAEFAVEGLDGITKQTDPVRIGRFALKGMHISNLLRKSAEMVELGRPPGLDQSLAIFALLEGIEINDVVGNAPGVLQPLRIDTLQCSWGQFVGPIPTKIRLTSKMTVPSTLADPTVGGLLADAGLPNVATSFDVGLAWSEPNQTLDLSPAAIELENAFVFSAKFSIINVSRGLFALDLMQIMVAANLAELGPLELSLRDTGVVQKAVAEYAKHKGISPEDARKEVIEGVMQASKLSAQANPDTTLVAQAVGKFIETPGSTLTIKVTPKDRVSLSKAFEVAMGDPNAAASLFTIEANTTQ